MIINDDIKHKIFNVLKNFNSEEYNYLQPQDLLKQNTIIIDFINEDSFSVIYIDSNDNLYFADRDINTKYDNDLNKLLYGDIIDYSIENTIYCRISNDDYVYEYNTIINKNTKTIILCLNKHINNSNSINMLINKFKIIAIYDEAYINCAIENINFNDVNIIYQAAFKNNKKLVDIDIKNIIRINSYAFYNCNDLLHINNCNNLQSIREYGFCKCEKLQSIQLYDTLTYLGEGAFKYCKQLQDINLQNTSLTTILKYTFANCISLKRIIMPTTLTSIQERAFYNCESLDLIWFKNFDHVVTTNISNGNNISNNIKIVVPDNLYTEWINSEPFQFAKEQIILESAYLSSLTN